MKSIEHFLKFFNCDTTEKVVQKLLLIDELTVENQQLVINALDSIDTELNEQMLYHSTIWDQLIRCYGRQTNVPHISKDIRADLLLTTELSAMRIDLENYHLRLQRDNIMLRNEQQLMKQLLDSQSELSAFLNKIHYGLCEGLVSSNPITGGQQNLVKNSLSNRLQVKKNELKLQFEITIQGIANLELIQKNNKTLLMKISNLLINLAQYKWPLTRKMD